MQTYLDMSEPERTSLHRDGGSVRAAMSAWELKNLALNTKGVVICPKNYSEFLL